MSDSKRILIVDDEAAIRKLLGSAFRGAGYEVRLAADGEQAVEACAAERFDVVLSDIKMPGMNGHELVRTVVGDQPDTLFVLMSGYDDSKCQSCGIAPRPCTFLPKPFLPKDVVALIDRAIRPASSTAPSPAGRPAPCSAVPRP